MLPTAHFTPSSVPEIASGGRDHAARERVAGRRVDEEENRATKWPRGETRRRRSFGLSKDAAKNDATTSDVMSDER